MNRSLDIWLQRVGLGALLALAATLLLVGVSFYAPRPSASLSLTEVRP